MEISAHLGENETVQKIGTLIRNASYYLKNTI